MGVVQLIYHPKLLATLNPIEKHHTEMLFQWRNNPKVFKWCRQHDLLDYGPHERWVESLGNDPKTKMYLVKSNDQADRPLGVCGLTNIDLLNQRAEFSLYIGREHQGAGYGRDALKLLLYHAFMSYPFNIIWGESFDGSPAIELFKSLGFKVDGKRRDFYFRESEFVDAILISIKRSEFSL